MDIFGFSINKKEGTRKRRKRNALDTELLDIPKLYELARQSYPVEDYSTMVYKDISDKMVLVKPTVPFTMLEALQILSIVNPDVSQSISNYVQLGNTGHFIEVVNKRRRESTKAIERIKDRAKNIFPLSAGVDGLVNALIGQIARTGALSSEIVMHNRLSLGVKEVVLVPVKSIRWVRNTETKELLPYQYIGSSYEFGPREQYIKLNPDTYKYYFLDALEDQPYAIPPIAAALASVSIQIDIMKHLGAIARKVGLVGFLSVLVSRPQQRTGEQDSAYKVRLKTYIEETAKTLLGNYSTGIFVGFKNAHEVTHESITSDLRSFKDVVQIVEEQVFSGLKSDPAMHGRTYSTTETYAGVVHDKLLAQADSLKRLVRRFIEYTYTLDLMSQGIYVDDVNLLFKVPKPLNDLQTQQARNQKFDLLVKMRDQNIIDQLQVAREMNVEQPSGPKPEPVAQPQQPGQPPQEEEEDPKKKDKPKKGKKEEERAFRAMYDPRSNDITVDEISGDEYDRRYNFEKE